MNGGTSRKISDSGVPVSPLITNSSRPCGGSVRPTIMLTTTTMPKCTRSMFSPCAIGTRSGTITSRMVISSSTIASSSISTSTHSRKPVADRFQPSNVPWIKCGTPSFATA